MTIAERLAALAAAPRNWRVTTHYADSAPYHHETHTSAQAETWAIGERRKIGKQLLSRETEKQVTVTAVTIGKIN